MKNTKTGNYKRKTQENDSFIYIYFLNSCYIIGDVHDIRIAKNQYETSLDKSF